MTIDVLPGLVYLPGSAPGPGRLAEVTLDVLEVGPARLSLPEVTVLDERPGTLFDGHGGSADLRAEPAGGGGPLAPRPAERQARAFGVVNVAYHAQWALRTAGELLGRDLPPLLVRIGLHEQRRPWGGGHYRVAARRYDPPEPGPVRPTGEIHLGGGSGYLEGPGGGYFAAPSHNLAIVHHEIAHHICRHTADFRLNRHRPHTGQTNKKVAVDEGTCDLLAAVMLDRPDIYAWHRAALAENDQRRRRLDPRWTMEHFRGAATDPHADGTIWASACWSARRAVIAEGHPARRFDRMLLRGLALVAERAGPEFGSGVGEDALRRMRYFSGPLEAMLQADPGLAGPVLSAMAAHGIRPGASNARLRNEARAGLAAPAGR
jgi:hypothetical protein